MFAQFYRLSTALIITIIAVLACSGIVDVLGIINAILPCSVIIMFAGTIAFLFIDDFFDNIDINARSL